MQIRARASGHRPFLNHHPFSKCFLQHKDILKTPDHRQDGMSLILVLVIGRVDDYWSYFFKIFEDISMFPRRYSSSHARDLLLPSKSGLSSWQTPEKQSSWETIPAAQHYGRRLRKCHHMRLDDSLDNFDVSTIFRCSRKPATWFSRPLDQISRASRSPVRQTVRNVALLLSESWHRPTRM